MKEEYEIQMDYSTQILTAHHTCAYQRSLGSCNVSGRCPQDVKFKGGDIHRMWTMKLTLKACTSCLAALLGAASWVSMQKVLGKCNGDKDVQE